MLSALLVVSAERRQLSEAGPSVLWNNKPILGSKLWSQKLQGAEHTGRKDKWHKSIVALVISLAGVWRHSQL